MSSRRVATRSTKAKEPCRYFQKNGSCAFGVKCLQSHGVDQCAPSRSGKRSWKDSPEPATVKAVGSGPNSDAEYRVPDTYTINKLDTESSHEVINTMASKISPCIFFMKGGCNDERCPFAHDTEGTKDTDADTSEDADRPTICRFYAVGECPNGRGCRFLHGDSQDDPIQLMTSASETHLVGPSRIEETSSFSSSHQSFIKSEQQARQVTPSELSIPTSVGHAQNVHPDGKEAFPNPRTMHIRGHLMNERPEEGKKDSRLYPYVGSVVPHWSQYADPHADGTVPFCKPHAQGVCSNGNDCRFRHSLTPQEYELLFQDLQPNLWTLHPRAADVVETSQTIHSRTHDANPLFQSEQQQWPRRKGLDPCKFYPSGKCRNGTDCPYEHIEPPSFTQTEPSAAASELRSSPVHDNEHERGTTPICKQFLRNGWCRGESCPFRHDVPEEQRWDTADLHTNEYSEDRSQSEWKGWEKVGDGKQKCRYYHQGTCDRGHTCRYSHDTVDASISFKDDSDNQRQQTLASGQNPQVDNSWWLDNDDNNGWSQSANAWDACTTPEEDADKTFTQIPALDSSVQNAEGSTDTPSATSENKDSANTEVSAVDDDSGWSNRWRVEPAEPVKPRRIQKPCKYFGQGHCAKGNDCPYLHITASGTLTNPSPPPLDNTGSGDVLQTPDDDDLVNSDAKFGLQREECDVSEPAIELTVQRMILGCNTYFRSDCSVEDVVTATDSRVIHLSNLPADVTPSDIETLVSPFGQCQNIMSIEEEEDNCIIQIEFAHEDQAASAVLHLHRQKYDSRIISARLSTYPLIDVRSPLETNTVKLSWPAPTITIWVHYGAISKAKSEAERLQGFTFAGTSIRSTFMKPEKRQSHSFAVKLEGLPVHMEKQSIQSLCPEATSISVDTPTYSQPAAPFIRDFLAQFGGALQFDEIPSDTSIDPTNPRRHIALVTLDTQDAVTAALKQLSETKHLFLGNQSIASESVYYTRYAIPAPMFAAIQSKLDELRDTPNISKQVKIRYHQDTTGIVQVHVFSSTKYRSTLIGIMRTVCILLRGSDLCVENRPFWDDYFNTSSSEKAMEKLNEDAQGSFFIICNRRTSEVGIYGDSSRGEAILRRMLKKVHSLQQRIDIPAACLQEVLHDKLQQLQEELGKNKVSIDIFTSQLLVRGDETVVQKARAIVDEIVMDRQWCAPTDSSIACPICLREPIAPVELSCKHAYCRACLQNLLCTAGHPRYPLLLCIAESSEDKSICGANILLSMALDIVPAAEGSSILRALFISNIRTAMNEKLFFCPIVGCETVHRCRESGFVVSCVSCRHHICCSCKTAAHNGLTCSENQEITQAVRVDGL